MKIILLFFIPTILSAATLLSNPGKLVTKNATKNEYKEVITNVNFFSLNTHDQRFYVQSIQTSSIDVKNGLNQAEKPDSLIIINTFKAEDLLKGKKKPNASWTIHANKVERWDSVIKSTEYACCAAFETYQLFDVTHGESLVAFDKEKWFLVADVPNSDRIERYVGVLSRYTGSHDLARWFTPRTYAIITYSTKEKQLRRIAIRKKDANPEDDYPDIFVEWKKRDGSNNSMDGHNISIWDANGQKDPKKALNNFDLSVEFYKDRHIKVLIPIEEDDLKISKAQLSPGLELVDIVESARPY